MRTLLVDRVLTARVLTAVVLALAAAVGGAGVSASVTPAPAVDDVDAYLHERMAATSTPGMAYAVVSPEAVEEVGFRGEDGDGEPVTAETTFLWGSVSKPVTATAVLTLVEGGQVDLDEPVGTYLPDLRLADNAATGLITARHLLNHTSGIPSGTGATDRFEPTDAPYRDALAELADTELLSVPGERYAYASENYLVLGALVEAVTGQPYDQYLADHVLGPWSMNDTVATPEDAVSRLPAGHGYAFGRPVALPVDFDPAGPSYGYLGGTVLDLAHFAVAQLNGGELGAAQVVQPESVELMRTDTVRVSDTIGYGHGWRVDTRNEDLGTSTVWHSGAVHGYQATLVLLPELERGVVVLQNAYGVFQDWELVATGLNAARILAGGNPEPVDGDPMYPVALGALLVALTGIGVATVWPVVTTVRRRPVRRRALLAVTAGWTAVGLLLAYVVGLALPDMLGARLSLIRLWAPDVGWLATVVVAGALLVVATRLATTAVRLRRPTEPAA